MDTPKQITAPIHKILNIVGEYGLQIETLISGIDAL